MSYEDQDRVKGCLLEWVPQVGVPAAAAFCDSTLIFEKSSDCWDCLKNQLMSPDVTRVCNPYNWVPDTPPNTNPAAHLGTVQVFPPEYSASSGLSGNQLGSINSTSKKSLGTSQSQSQSYSQSQSHPQFTFPWNQASQNISHVSNFQKQQLQGYLENAQHSAKMWDPNIVKMTQGEPGKWVENPNYDYNTCYVRVYENSKRCNYPCGWDSDVYKLNIPNQ